jgi:hypothetical protein
MIFGRPNSGVSKLTVRSVTVGRKLILTSFMACTIGCYAVSSEVVAIGGSWSIEKQTMHGSEPSLSKNRLRRDQTLVGDWVDRYEFFPPECIVYRTKNADRSWMAACGDHAPIRLPEWVLEVRGDAAWGGYVSTTDANGRTTERWSRLPIEKVLAAATAQRTDISLFGWRPPAPAPAFPREYIDLRGAEPSRPPAIVADNDLASRASLAQKGLCRDAPAVPGFSRINDDQLAGSDIGGGIDVINIQAVGSEFQESGGWPTVESYVRTAIVQRPLKVFRYNPWPDEDKSRLGITAIVHFRSGLTGRLDAVGQHLCVADPNGAFWWWSVAPRDVFPSRKATP